MAATAGVLEAGRLRCCLQQWRLGQRRRHVGCAAVCTAGTYRPPRDSCLNSTRAEPRCMLFLRPKHRLCLLFVAAQDEVFRSTSTPGFYSRWQECPNGLLWGKVVSQPLLNADPLQAVLPLRVLSAGCIRNESCCCKPL